MVGITSYGAYIPRLRLNRMSIFQSIGWFAPALMVVAQGERSMCYWDEDALTMAVEASRDCLNGQDKNALDAVYIGSMTMPFEDRLNAGILSTALNLRDDVNSADFSGSMRAGASALVAAIDAVKGGEKKNVLVTASDKPETKPAYFYEMWYGDGAASVTVGSENVIAEFLGSHTLTYDFVDHYRGKGKRFDYFWEERWARDEGFSRIIPETIKGLLEKTNLTIDQVDKIVFPCIFKAEYKKIAKILGAAPEKIADNMHAETGQCGTAHAMVMLARELETAEPGQVIVMASFGNGCDAMAFKVTDEIKKLATRLGVSGCLANKKEIDNYAKYLIWRGLLEPEMGIRAEAPTQTAMTTLWRKRKMILGLVGGKCRECDTAQFPKMDYCVNPECNAHQSQDDYEFSHRTARIKTFTADLLAVSVDPPHKYGMIQFEGGGRYMADFTDIDQDELKVGLPMKVVFRRRVVDRERGFTNYFWKATPQPGAVDEMKKIRYDGRVAIVTGAGGGLGRVYALELAKRGCKVVVNDLGGARDGSGGGSATPAQSVVDEIEALGGKAVPNYDNVATQEGGEAIVKTALDAFGRVDIVINNAGILRDKSFTKMEPENWNAVLDVHLNGAYQVTRAAWPHMRDQKFGRVVMTTSAAGLYGNFGQSNYSAAKMGLVGLMNTLKLEGGKYNIKVNTLAPLAASRLTEDIMPPDVFEKMKPEFVAPMVMYLVSDQCAETGQVFNAGMGYFNRAAMLTGPGLQIGTVEDPPTVEDVMDFWDDINRMDGAEELSDATAALVALTTPKAPPEPEAAGGGGGGAPAGGGGGGLDVTPAQVFEVMPSTFKADAAEGVDVVFQYEISGASGGSWSVSVKDKKVDIQEGKAAKPTCTLKMADADFVDMVTGKLNPMTAFTSGKLAIEGDVMKSQLIEKLFEPPKM
ncbi:MAG: SDR family NAD(P)-dependent oxidoreductase [Desulfatibacillaceae bacterium]